MQNPFRSGRTRLAVELCLIFIVGIGVYAISAYLDLAEEVIHFLADLEYKQADELIMVALYLVLALMAFSARRWQEASESEQNLRRQNEDLEMALSEIKQLQGIIPICMSCKKIRDDAGLWHQVELYMRDHTDAEFSHSLCQDCMKKLYPEFVENEQTPGKTAK